ncbi:hypothetical protein BT96DRAFT_512559 [Gymnopus androsaceus JB14]|uniref:Uncharacterized protein n=1 Tax=Gymnopus androsaceus JB14 TaxID=1447944 RepID=A0A6A4GMD7_9AGAR|nr:hypothetical protein BT96DRAFT_512559 [Gymnopus androsaceus JB14]
MESSRKKKAGSATSTSYYIAQLPPKIIPQPPPPPHPHPRINPRSKSTTKASPSIMGALLEEEDEDRESARRTSQASLRSSASASERLVRSNSLNSSSTRLRTSNEMAKQPTATFIAPKLTIRSTLSSFISSTSYASSIPSSGTPGFTSLTLPRAPQPAFTPNASSKRVSVIGGTDGKIDLTKSGIAQTTMATVEVTKGLASSKGIFGFGSILSRARSRSVSAKVVGTGVTSDEGPRSFSSRKAGIDAVLSFTSYRRPPDYIPSGSVLVQVWAVAVDGLSGVVTSRSWDWNFSSAPRAKYQ